MPREKLDTPEFPPQQSGGFYYYLSAEWAALFEGFLNELAKPYKWEVGETSTTIDTAIQWANSIERVAPPPAGNGVTDVRFRDCTFEFYKDGEWESVFIVEPGDPPEVCYKGLPGDDGLNGVDGQDGAPGTIANIDDEVVEPDDRTLDHIFGACMLTVQWMYDEMIDWVSAVEGITDTVQAIANLIGTVPFAGEVIDLVGTKDFIDFVAGIAEVTQTQFEADYDVDLQRTLACYMFCEIRARDNKFNRAAFAETLGEWSIGAGFNTARLGLSAFGDLMQLWFTRVTREYLLGLNNPDGDWTALCLQCNSLPDPCRVWVGYALEGWTAYQTYPGTLATWDTPNDAWTPGNRTTDNNKIITIKIGQEVPELSYQITVNGTFNPAFDDPEIGIYAIDNGNVTQVASGDVVITPIGASYVASGTLTVTGAGQTLAVAAVGVPGQTALTIDYVNVECL